MASKANAHWYPSAATTSPPSAGLTRVVERAALDEQLSGQDLRGDGGRRRIEERVGSAEDGGDDDELPDLDRSECDEKGDGPDRHATGGI